MVLTASEGGSNSVGAGESKIPKVRALFVLGKALPMIPSRLVKKILKGDFVNMAEILRDNGEMLDILSWVQCFSLLVKQKHLLANEKM